MADRLIVGRGRCHGCDGEIHLVFASVGDCWVHTYEGCESCNDGYLLLDDVVDATDDDEIRIVYQAGESPEDPIWMFEPGTRVALGPDLRPGHAPDLMIDQVLRAVEPKTPPRDYPLEQFPVFAPPDLSDAGFETRRLTVPKRDHYDPPPPGKDTICRLDDLDPFTRHRLCWDEETEYRWKALVPGLHPSILMRLLQSLVERLDLPRDLVVEINLVLVHKGIEIRLFHPLTRLTCSEIITFQELSDIHRDQLHKLVCMRFENQVESFKRGFEERGWICRDGQVYDKA